ncbi:MULTISPECIES: biliverdin-producing heme oxygenase [unclassified Janthinobacterium]|uniref:biliverdin-producing heme oxygenase n=1 Tax=unclassified Janthinobacterium TaxID=2610881 RepID=UPI00160C6C92|nr:MULTISPECIES: biliverdin-producing heme oxygenase [unclassified Janthinobacterium]MBB5368906.1 heme oxygenase [Janthinobacterium sp. K2C7]MBB5381558.1 heme oxygenase [Janthinobacterium sp. K2Li3]MBB5387288.1 heme oxygenase [Janthinobacterium sp. K2E3]
MNANTLNHLTDTSLPRSQRLKADTMETHDVLDKRIMASKPFENTQNYTRFLQAQYAFLRDVDALYDHAGLAALLPDLQQRRRYDSIAADLHDLGAPVPADAVEAPFGAQLDMATALGWLYVSEGSKLGAAILYKLAGKIGLDEHHGARHLAGHPDGRARHWRDFTAVLDAAPLDADGEARVIDGARAAFMRMHGHVEAYA